MENSIVTIDQVSKEVKTKISKLGYDALIKKYNSGLFETNEEIAAARFYMIKRGVEEFVFTEADKHFYSKFFNSQTTTTTTFGKHRSEMSAEQIEAAEQRLEQTKNINKQKLAESKQQSVVDAENNSEQQNTTPTKEQIKTVKEKQPVEPVMKLTEQESTLFDIIKQNDSPDHTQFFNNPFKSLREYKGVLGSLKKKGIISYNNESTTLTLKPIGIQMVNGELPYKQKAKHEQNFFKKTRITVEVEGKKLEKSAYVRMLLRKTNHITCAELNDLLAAVGFSKLYHSELQRCKQQLGIVTDKNKD